MGSAGKMPDERSDERGGRSAVDARVLDIQIDFLKREYEAINKTIERIDNIISGMKNWTVVVWGGMMTVLLSQKLYELVVVAAVVPIVFYFSDAWWRHLQWRFVHRIKVLSDFLSGQVLRDSVAAGHVLGIAVLDPKSDADRETTSYKEMVSYKKALGTHRVRPFYGAFVFTSIVVWTVLMWVWRPS